jgi:hypothetical protein
MISDVDKKWYDANVMRFERTSVRTLEGGWF